MGTLQNTITQSSIDPGAGTTPGNFCAALFGTKRYGFGQFTEAIYIVDLDPSGVGRVMGSTPSSVGAISSSGNYFPIEPQVTPDGKWRLWAYSGTTLRTYDLRPSGTGNIVIANITSSDFTASGTITGFKIVRDGSKWYGFIGATANLQIIDLDPSGTGSPAPGSYSSVGSISISNNTNGLDVVKAGSKWYAFVCSQLNQLHTVDLDTGNTGSITPGSLSVVNTIGTTVASLRPTVFFDGIKWYAIVRSNTSGTNCLRVIKFGDTSTLTPGSSAIVTSNVSCPGASFNDFIKLNNQYHAFVVRLNNSVSNFVFWDWDPNRTGNLDPNNASTAYAFSFLSAGNGRWGYFFTIDSKVYAIGSTSSGSQSSDWNIWQLSEPTVAEVIYPTLNASNYSNSVYTIDSTLLQNEFEVGIRSARVAYIDGTIAYNTSTRTITNGTVILSTSSSDIQLGNTVTVGSGAVLRLGKKASYTLVPFLSVSSGTLEVYDDSDRSGSSLDLFDASFTSASINLASGATAATVIVSPSSLPNITAGSGVTLTTPSVNLTAPNFADGSRYQVSRLQIFSVSSSAINTTTDELTLGIDSNGDAPSLQTSTPYSLVRISLAAGATIPVSSPQIFDGGLYRIKTNSSGVVTLSTTEGGTTIDFQSTGTNNGSGQLLTITTITNLGRGIVSGGAGLSIPLSLPTGALLDVKAIDYSETSGSTVTSQISQNTLAWSSVSGATIIDIVDRTDPTSAWTLVNRIAQISTIELSATVVDNNGVVYTSFNPSNTGSTVTGLSWGLEGVGRIQINANESDGLIWAQDLVLWAAYIFSTADGLWLASADTITLNDLYTVIIKNIEFDETSGNILQIAGMYIGSASGQSIVSSSTTGPVVPNVATQGNGALVETGVSGLTATESNTLSTLGSQLSLLYKRQGLQAGVSASEKDATTGSPGFVTTSDGSVNQTIIKNGDGSITISSS